MRERAGVIKPWLTLARKDEGDLIGKMALSPDGKFLAIVSDVSRGRLGRADPAVSIWDLTMRKRTASIPGTFRFDLGVIGFSPDGRLLAAGSFTDDITLWDVRNGRKVATIDLDGPGEALRPDAADRNEVTRLDFTPDGKSLMVYPSVEGRLRVWDVAGHREIESWSTRSDLELAGLMFRQGNQVLAVGYSRRVVAGFFGVKETEQLVLWDLQEKKQCWSYTLNASNHGFAMSKMAGGFHPWGGGERSRGPPKVITLLNTTTGRPAAVYRPPSGLWGWRWLPAAGS